MDATVDFYTTLTVDVHVHDISDYVPELVESSASSICDRSDF